MSHEMFICHLISHHVASMLSQKAISKLEHLMECFVYETTQDVSLGQLHHVSQQRDTTKHSSSCYMRYSTQCSPSLCVMNRYIYVCILNHRCFFPYSNFVSGRNQVWGYMLCIAIAIKYFLK